MKAVVFTKVNFFAGILLFVVTAVVTGSLSISERAWGQTSAVTGTITGVVTDAAGAPIQDAVVTAINIATNLPTKTKTNAQGSYSIPSISAGSYTVRIESPGFAAVEKNGILVEPNSVVRVDQALKVGNVAQTVNVTEQAPLLETQTVTLNTTIPRDFVESLPNEVSGGIRDITALLNLAPGVVQGFNSFEGNITGGRSYATELLLDGVPLTYNPLNSVPYTNKPDQDIISEVQVQTGVPLAEWGHTSGGIGSFISRSGGNQYHGDAVLLLRNTVLDATPYNSKTKTRDQQFEIPLSIGGPIRIPKLYDGKDRSFFFFNYSLYRTASNTPPQVTTVPTVLERGGNFSDLPGGELIYDPTTGQPFAAIPGEPGCTVGRCIPQSSFSPISAEYLTKFIPSPSNSALVNNFIGRTPSADSENHYFAKVDQRIGNSNTAHVTYRRDNLVTVEANSPWGSVLGGENRATRASSLTLGDDSILRSNLVNSLSANYSRWAYNDVATPLNLFQQIPGSYGPGFPDVGFTTLYGSGTTIGDNDDASYGDGLWNFNESLSWEVRRHSFKFGARYSDYIDQSSTGAGAENGEYFFSPLQTAGGNNTDGNPFASYLLGSVDYAFQTITQAVGFSSKYWAFYAEDHYRVTPKVTVNLGLRWDIQHPFNAPRGIIVDQNTPNPGAGNLPGAIIYKGTNGTGQNFFPTWYGAVAPRLGAAWSVTPDTVVRAGFGIMYQPLQIAISTSSFPGTGIISPAPGVPAFQWDSGWPADQVVPPVIVQNPAVSNGQSVQTADFRNGKTNRLPDEEIFQFDIQHSFKGILLDAGYLGQFTHNIVGSSGFDLVQLANINQLPVSDLKYGLLLGDSIYDPAVVAAGFKPPYEGFTGTLAQSLRAFPQYQNVVSILPRGYSNYNALILSAQERLSHGLQFIVSYTVAKTIANVGTSNFGLPAPQDQYDPRSLRSVADDDIPRVLSLSYVYQLPLGHGQAFANSGFVGRALEGFSVTGVQYYQAGTPIEIAAPNNDLPIFNGVLQLDRGTGPFTTGKGRGSIEVGNSLYGTTGTTYLNQAAFALPAPVTIPDPNNPGNTIANPAVVANPNLALGNLKLVLPNVRNLGTFSENLSIFKRQTFFERYTFQIGADFLNALNRKNFSDLNTVYGSPGFGAYGANATGPRVIQINSKITF